MEWRSFFFQAEDGIRDLVRSRGLGDVYKRQELEVGRELLAEADQLGRHLARDGERVGAPLAVQRLSLIHI